jgi:hypothetical protein
MRTEWMVGNVAALMLFTTPAIAARCKVGEIYRPSINKCVSKASAEAKQILGLNKKQPVVTRGGKIPLVAAEVRSAFAPEEAGSASMLLSYDTPARELSLWPLPRANVFDWERAPQ